MDFVGKQLLWFLIIEHGALIFLFIKYGLPKINQIAANQQILNKDDKTLLGEIVAIRDEIRNQKNVAGLV